MQKGDSEMTSTRCAAGAQRGEAMRSIMLDLLSDSYHSGLADRGGVRLPQEVVGPPVPVLVSISWQSAGRLAPERSAT